MAQLNSLQDLFNEQLEDLYDAENQLVKALPLMAQSASSSQLKQAFTHHLEQTRHHVQRLEQVFQAMGTSPKSKTCAAMQGLIKEGNELMHERADKSVMDAGLIGAAQKVEHYEMAGYGTLRTWAQQLGNTQAAQLLQQTLQEEEQADKLLTQIAESNVNPRAQ